MFYRIAVGAGLFLLGYALGRGTRHPVSPHEPSGTSRIRDALAEKMGQDPQNEERPSSGTKSPPGTD